MARLIVLSISAAAVLSSLFVILSPEGSDESALKSGVSQSPIVVVAPSPLSFKAGSTPLSAPSALNSHLSQALNSAKESQSTATLDDRFRVMQSDFDNEFDTLPRNMHLEKLFTRTYSKELEKVPYLKSDEPPEIVCKGDRCRITGQLVRDISEHNSNLAIDHLRRLFSGSETKEALFSSKRGMYSSKDGHIIFRSFFELKDL